MVAIWLLLVLFKVSRDKTKNKALFWPKVGFCPGPGRTRPLQHVGNKGNSHRRHHFSDLLQNPVREYMFQFCENHLYQKPQECQRLFLIWLVEHWEMMELRECRVLNVDQGNFYAHSLSLKSTRSVRGRNNWRCLRRAFSISSYSHFLSRFSPWT